MTTDELEKLLRAWGYVFGERRTPDWEDGEPPAAASHPLARGMEFAPGKRVAIIRQRTNMDRGGVGRRSMMAQAASADCPTLARMRVVPMGYVDPVPCVETRSGGSESSDWPVPPELQRVQRAALDLHAIDTVRGVCLRIHYCMRGDLDDKASAATLRIGSPMKVRSYRDAVKEARFWMLGRLAA